MPRASHGGLTPRNDTTAVLVVAEAVHASAPEDVPRLTAAIADALAGAWSTEPAIATLSRSAPRLDVPE